MTTTALWDHYCATLVMWSHRGGVSGGRAPVMTDVASTVQEENVWWGETLGVGARCELSGPE